MRHFAEEWKALGAVVLTIVFQGGILSAPLRPCSHHGTTPTTFGAAAHGPSASHGSAGHAHQDTPSAGDEERHDSAHHAPCTCLAECETATGAPGGPATTHLAAHDPPLLTVPSADAERVLPRARGHRILPFPNPPPLAG